MSWNLQKEIKEILATEIGTQIFAPGRRTPVAFLYPNTYHLGMSNLGLHILYQILNREGWACERVFLPETKKREEYAKTKTALFSMETQRPLADFPYICATISFEMDYLNFLIQLQMGHIKLLAEERGEKDPFVIIGGPCATFNPEPLAEFADLVVIGEGEETLPKLLRLLEQLRMEETSEAFGTVAYGKENTQGKTAGSGTVAGGVCAAFLCTAVRQDRRLYRYGTPGNGTGNNQPSVGERIGRVSPYFGYYFTLYRICQHVHCGSGPGLWTALPVLHGGLLLPQAP